MATDPSAAENSLPREADIVIIGGGIMGCATAYYLAKRGVRAVLLEKGRLVGEQSSRAWGFVRQQNRHPAELPLMVAANRIWRELSAELEADIEWRQGGILSLAHTEDELEYSEGRAALEQAHGVDSRMVTAQEVRALLPGFAAQVLGGLHTPSDGNAEPAKASGAFAAAAERAGARLIPYCAVERVLVSNGRVTGVRTERGEIDCKVAVCAAGAHSSTLARMIGLDLPVRNVRGTVGATAPLPPISALCVRGGRVSFRQRPNGVVYMASSYEGSADYDVTLEAFRHLRWFLPNFRENRPMVNLHVGMPLVRDLWRALPFSSARRHPFAHLVDVEPPPNPKTVERNRRHFGEFFPAHKDVTIERAWAGLIDTMPDLIPVVGEADDVAGFHFATGFSGHGFAMGPIIGRLMTELLVDGRPSLDLAPFRFSRFREGKLAPAAKVR